MTEPLDITELEDEWIIYKAGNLTGVVKINLAARMGEGMGPVLREIRILRTQVVGLRAALKEESQKSQESEFDYMMDVEV